MRMGARTLIVILLGGLTGYFFGGIFPTENGDGHPDPMTEDADSTDNGVAEPTGPEVRISSPGLEPVDSAIPDRPVIDYETKLEAIFAMEVKQERMRALFKLFSEMRLAEVGTVMSLLDDMLDESQFEEAILPFVAYYADLDPDAASAFAASLDGKTGDRALMVAIRQRGRADPERTWEWLNTAVLDPADYETGRRALIHVWAQESLDKATEFYLGRPGEELTPYEIVALSAHHIDAGGASGALHWLEELETHCPERSAEAREAVVRLWASDSPQEVVDWLSASSDPAAHLMRICAGRWAEKDLNGAGDYLVAMEPGPLRESVAGGIMEAWVRESPEAAMEWIQGQAWGSDHDMVLSAFSEGVARLDPEGAITWAGMIQSDDARRELVISIAENWYAKDPNAVLNWLQNQDLSPQERLRITTFSEDDLKERLGANPEVRMRTPGGRYSYP